MSEERKKVLAMLAEGKISADEAERLLEKLGTEGDTGRHRHGRHGHRRRKRLHIGAAALHGGETEAAGKVEDTSEGGNNSEARTAAPKYLRVEVHSTDDDHISVRVPLGLIRTGVKLTTMLPSDTSAKLAEKGIDLSELGKLEGQELVDALRELRVDVESADGDTVRVFCE